MCHDNNWTFDMNKFIGDYVLRDRTVTVRRMKEMLIAEMQRLERR